MPTDKKDNAQKAFGEQESEHDSFNTAIIVQQAAILKAY